MSSTSKDTLQLATCTAREELKWAKKRLGWGAKKRLGWRERTNYQHLTKSQNISVYFIKIKAKQDPSATPGSPDTVRHAQGLADWHHLQIPAPDCVTNTSCSALSVDLKQSGLTLRASEPRVRQSRAGRAAEPPWSPWPAHEELGISRAAWGSACPAVPSAASSREVGQRKQRAQSTAIQAVLVTLSINFNLISAYPKAKSNLRMQLWSHYWHVEFKLAQCARTDERRGCVI